MSNKIELGGAFSEGYGIVPKKILRANDISSNTKLMLCYMLSFTGGGIACFPSIRTMSEELNISGRTIIRCIKEAEEKGLMSKHQKSLGGKLGKQNVYELLFMHDSPHANKQRIDSDKMALAKLALAKLAHATNDKKTELASDTRETEYNHININNIIPDNLNTDKFKQAFTTWLEYKKKRREIYKSEHSISLLLKRLSLFGEDWSCARIEKSIMNNYAGLIFDNDIPSNSTKPAIRQVNNVIIQ